MLWFMLRCFEAVLDLKINFAKSYMMALGEVVNMKMLASNLEYRMDQLLITYLGMPLGAIFKEQIYGCQSKIG